MVSEVRQVLTHRGLGSGPCGYKVGGLGSDNVLFLDLGADYMAIFTLRKFMNLYTYYLCTFLLSVNIKFAEIKITHVSLTLR